MNAAALTTGAGKYRTAFAVAGLALLLLIERHAAAAPRSQQGAERPAAQTAAGERTGEERTGEERAGDVRTGETRTGKARKADERRGGAGVRVNDGPIPAGGANVGDDPTRAAATAPLPVRGKLEGELIRRRPQVEERATARKAPKPNSQGMEIGRLVAALGVVIGLIFLMRWLAKRFFVTPGGGGASRVVQVLSRTPLAPKQQLLMIQVGRRIVLASDSGGQMNSLCEISDPDEVAALIGQMLEEKAAASPRSFGSLFGRMRRGFDEQAAAGESGLPGETAAGARDDDPEEEASDPALTSTRTELRGLMERVRVLSRQFKSS